MKLEKSEIVGSIVALLVIGAWVLNWFLIPIFISKPAEQGTFGDRFGAVNALFSGLAFVGIIYTIIIQRRESVKDADERKVERELSIIFQLINFQHTALENIATDNNVGRKALNLINDNLKSTLKGMDLYSVANKEAYRRHTEAYSSKYLHYIKTLETTFGYIANSKNLGESDKLTLIIIFKSQLSSIDLCLLAYKMYYYSTSEILKKQSIKYRLFENINTIDLGNEDHYRAFIPAN